MSGTRPNFGGMTVTERLVTAGLTGGFDDAIAVRDRQRAIELLEQVAMSKDSAAMTVNAVLADPAKYGHPRTGGRVRTCAEEEPPHVMPPA